MKWTQLLTELAPLEAEIMAELDYPPLSGVADVRPQVKRLRDAALALGRPDAPLLAEALDRLLAGPEITRKAFVDAMTVGQSDDYPGPFVRDIGSEHLYWRGPTRKFDLQLDVGRAKILDARERELMQEDPDDAWY